MRKGESTYILDKKVYIDSVASIAGSYEAKGNLREFIDYIIEDDMWGCKTHEMAEIKMQKTNIKNCLDKAGLTQHDVDCIVGGDLINQIVPTTFSAREFEVPFMGLYNACATFGEALIVASNLIVNDMSKIIAITSSHFATAERQYRYPLELGTQPTPSSQMTVTGSGCVLLTDKPCDKPYISAYTVGKIVDLKCTDVNNMGAAMAPAAFDTIYTHLKSTNTQPSDYDMIITGDLGKFGRETLHFLLAREGIQADNLNDCGSLVYSKEQKVGQGGSGAGCCSLVFCSYFYRLLCCGQLHKILFVPTGALLSKDSPLQGESIPAIAHAVVIESECQGENQTDNAIDGNSN
ncbi:MAG: stage V sporulation protein AD [Christensenellales bacterium]